MGKTVGRKRGNIMTNNQQRDNSKRTTEEEKDKRE